MKRTKDILAAITFLTTSLLLLVVQLYGPEARSLSSQPLCETSEAVVVEEDDGGQTAISFLAEEGGKDS